MKIIERPLPPSCDWGKVLALGQQSEPIEPGFENVMQIAKKLNLGRWATMIRLSHAVAAGTVEERKFRIVGKYGKVHNAKHYRVITQKPRSK